MKKNLIIATRESPLALWQANWVKNQLQTIHPGLAISLFGMTTQADRMLSLPIEKMGGKGVFVKELEDALLDKRADIAVHSMKDVPMELPSDLILPVMCEREDPRDAFVSNHYQSFQELPLNAIVGTSSLRRQSQLAALRPDLVMRPLRGNVGTRLKRLDNGEFAAIILAAAGLKRLDLSDRIASCLSIKQSIPAAGQGVLGIECRADSDDVQRLILPLAHSQTQQCVLAERAMCRRLGGGCQLPVAGFATLCKDTIELTGLVANETGTLLIQHTMQGVDPDALGKQVAEYLLKHGAGDILRDIQSR